MRVLLLNPPAKDRKAYIREGRCNQEQGVWTTLWPPVTLATAGAMLENEGHRVEIVDCAASDVAYETLLDRVSQNRYDLIAWSTATPSISSDLSLSEELKTSASKNFTCVFGTHVSALPDKCLQEAPRLDFIIRNEPEDTLIELVGALSGAKSLSEVKGISYRDLSGHVIHNQDRPFIKDLDRLPIPAWHLLDLDRYRLPLLGKRFLMLSPLRGCPYPCIFCTAHTYYGRSLRRRTVPIMIEEINRLQNSQGIDAFFIWADTFTADNRYVLDFCSAILDQKLDVMWACNSRVDTVTSDLLKYMASAGCWMISFGIESASIDVLAWIKKKTTPAQAIQAVKWAKAAGIKTAGHFVFGLPGDSEQNIKETIDLSLGLNLDMAQFYCAVPFPGSELYETAIANGWIKANSFADFRQDKAVMELPGLSRSVVDYYRKTAFRRFYLRPRQLMSMLRLLRVEALRQTFRGGIRFLRWVTS